MFIKKGKCPLLSERAFVAACCSLDPAEILVDPDVPAAGDPPIPVVPRTVVALDGDGEERVPFPRRLDAVGGMDEGFSIPAQREANQRKAESMGAYIVKEFADRGESAKTADRPALQEMLEYLMTHRVD